MQGILCLLCLYGVTIVVTSVSQSELMKDLSLVLHLPATKLSASWAEQYHLAAQPFAFAFAVGFSLVLIKVRKQLKQHLICRSCTFIQLARACTSGINPVCTFCSTCVMTQ